MDLQCRVFFNMSNIAVVLSELHWYLDFWNLLQSIILFSSMAHIHNIITAWTFWSLECSFMTFFLCILFVLNLCRKVFKKVFSISSMCMNTHFMWAWSSQYSEDGLRPPEIAVMDSCEPMYLQEIELSCLQDLQELFTAEPSLLS